MNLLLRTRLEERSIPEPNSGCTIWLGALTEAGYGQLYHEGRNQYAHRLSFEEFVGPLGPDEACHRCDMTWCINSNHLFRGTHKQNFEDAARKGRLARQTGELSGMSKLIAKQVIEIRADLRSHRMIASDYGISNRHVSAIKRYEVWRHL